jgi:hypothetical protein
MPIDPEISLGVKTPDVAQTIGGIANAGLAMQEMKNAQLNYQKNQQTFGAQVNQINANSQTAQNQAQQTGFNLNQDQVATARQNLASLVNDPDIVAASQTTDPAQLQAFGVSATNKITQAIANIINTGVPPDIAYKMAQPFLNAAQTNPASLQTMMKQAMLAGQNSAQQTSTIQPTPQAVDNGQQGQLVNSNPMAQGGVGSAMPNTQIQHQLPPTANVFNPSTQTEQAVGIAPNQAPGPVQTSAPLGQPQAAAATAVINPQMVAKDYEGTVSAAEAANKALPVLQNIRMLAPTAATGVGADRRLIVDKLAALVGMTPEQLTSTSTDLLSKNSAMLSLAGGNTDYSRQLAQIANPNVHMTPQAIQEAVDQIAAQQKLALAKQKFLQGYVNNPQQYMQKLQQFNENTDPHVFQWANMTIPQKAAYKGSLTPAQQARFKAQGAWMDQNLQ